MPNTNTVTQEHINKMFDEADKEPWCVYGKCYVLAIRLKNGFTIIQDASCVDPANFDIEIGKKIVEEKIKNKLWELEGYKLQNELSKIDSDIN